MESLVDIQSLICEVIAKELTISASEINANDSFYDLGLDSVNSIFLLSEMEHKLSIDIDPMSVYDNPTVESFAKFLLSVLNE